MANSLEHYQVVGDPFGRPSRKRWPAAKKQISFPGVENIRKEVIFRERRISNTRGCPLAKPSASPERLRKSRKVAGMGGPLGSHPSACFLIFAQTGSDAFKLGRGSFDILAAGTRFTASAIGSQKATVNADIPSERPQDLPPPSADRVHSLIRGMAHAMEFGKSRPWKHFSSIYIITLSP